MLVEGLVHTYMLVEGLVHTYIWWHVRRLEPYCMHDTTPTAGKPDQRVHTGSDARAESLARETSHRSGSRSPVTCNHNATIMWRKLLNPRFETCLGPSIQGAGAKTHHKSRFCAILKKRGDATVRDGLQALF